MLIPTVIAAGAAYLTGSVPFGLLTARYAKGIDIRTAGSGNIGATNVGRVLGTKWGIFVLILDAVKGILPTVLFPLAVLEGGDPRVLHVRVACGLATIVGHMFPCWLRFHGGKGVATALGVILVLDWVSTLIALAMFALIFAVFRIVSLSSMVAAISFLIAVLWSKLPSPFSSETWSLAGFAIAVPVLIIIRHRGNLARLVRGEEPRYRSRKASASGDGHANVDRAQESESARTSESSE